MYTPGPWKVKWTKDHRLFSIQGKSLTHAGMCQIAEGIVHPGHDAEANANLLEAAPTLLKALETAVRVMQNYCLDEALSSEFEQFTDAIAAAKGK